MSHASQAHIERAYERIAELEALVRLNAAMTKAAVEQEREACARIADEWHDDSQDAPDEIAKEIRARGVSLSSNSQ